MRFVLTLALVLMTVASASAKKMPIELKGSVSWALSEGINFAGETVNLPGGDEFFNELDLSDGIAYGLGIGVHTSRNLEFAFLWDYQASELVAKGSTDMKIGDVGIDNYHGVLIYNFGSPVSKLRPMLFGGLGATYFRSIEFTDLAGETRSTGGNGEFSTTWGAGVKYFLNDRFGIQLDFKWTPTYAKSNPDGYWCDPYWGCYTSSDSDYINQWKFGGTLLARF